MREASKADGLAAEVETIYVAVRTKPISPG
jgi:hypothetical protein